MKFRINSIILYVIFSLITYGCGTDASSTDHWNSAGLHDTHIQTIHAIGEVIFVGTSQGVYKKDIQLDSGWNKSGLDIDSSVVVDFILWSPEELLAAIKYDAVRTKKPTLFKSVDGGDFWMPVQINKPEELNYFVIKDMEKQSGTQKNLFTYVGRIVKSEDGGRVWNIVYEEGGVSEFLTIDDNYPNYIWTGGWTNIFSPYLAKSEDGGKTWALLNSNVYTNSDATCYDIVAHPDNPGLILVTMGGSVATANVIRKSNNGGQTWQTVMEGINTGTFTHSARSTKTVYASGRNTSGTLFFAQTENFGDSWEIIEMENSPTDIQVNDMVAVETEGREVLYFGTNKGVYSYMFDE